MLISEKKKLHTKFWKGELERPMLGVFLPYPEANYPAIDIDLPVKKIMEKNRKWIEFFNNTPDERMPCVWINYGPVFLGALAGAKMEWNNDTSWSRSLASSIDELTPPLFDKNDGLWQNYIAKFIKIKNSHFPNAIIGLTDFIGPFDILAALVGSEALCMDLMLKPEKIEGLAEKCTDLWLACYNEHFELLPEKDGTTDVFGLFCPGRGARWSEDFTALIRPDLYREFVLAHDTRLAANLDTSYIHIHSAGIKSLEHILQIPELSGVEISNDPNGPSLEEILNWAQEAYGQGKSVMLSNWKKRLERKDVKLILSRIDPSRTIVTLEAKDMEEAALWRDMFHASRSEG